MYRQQQFLIVIVLPLRYYFAWFSFHCKLCIHIYEQCTYQWLFDITFRIPLCAICTVHVIVTYCDAHRSKKKHTQNERFRHSGICEERSGGKIEPSFYWRNINYYHSNRMIFTVEPNSIKKHKKTFNFISKQCQHHYHRQLRPKTYFSAIIVWCKEMKRNKYKRWNGKYKTPNRKKWIFYFILICVHCGVAGWLGGWPFFYFVEKFAFFFVVVKVNERTCLLILH